MVHTFVLIIECISTYTISKAVSTTISQKFMLQLSPISLIQVFQLPSSTPFAPIVLQRRITFVYDLASFTILSAQSTHPPPIFHIASLFVWSGISIRIPPTLNRFHYCRIFIHILASALQSSSESKRWVRDEIEPTAIVSPWQMCSAASHSCQCISLSSSPKHCFFFSD